MINHLDLIEKYHEVNHLGNSLNFELISISEGNVKYQLTIANQHLATPTASHGGTLSALMDQIIGVAALSLSSKNNCLVSTVEFKINFISPALLGEIIVGKGKVIKEGKRLIIVEGKIIENKTNRIIAKGIGTCSVYPASKAGF